MKYVRFGRRVYLLPRMMSHGVFVMVLGGDALPTSAGFVAFDADGFLYTFGGSKSLGLVTLWDDVNLICEQLERP